MCIDKSLFFPDFGTPRLLRARGEKVITRSEYRLFLVLKSKVQVAQ